MLGIYGFMGCGQLELARTLFGKLRPDHGALAIAGKPTNLGNTAAARQAGIAYVAESRRAMLFGEEPVYKNISIASSAAVAVAAQARPRAGASPASRSRRSTSARPTSRRGSRAFRAAISRRSRSPSGSPTPPRILLLAEPTRGMDVGAKEDVVKIVRALRDQGIAIVVFSTEPETVLSLADRVLVMRKGEIAHEFADEAISKDRLLAAA